MRGDVAAVLEPAPLLFGRELNLLRPPAPPRGTSSAAAFEMPGERPRLGDDKAAVEVIASRARTRIMAREVWSFPELA